MNSFVASAATAKKWLEAANPPSQEARSMKQLGLWLCAHITSEVDGCLSVGKGIFKLPRMSRFLALERPELLKLAQDVTVHSKELKPMTRLDRNEWARLLGAMAMSYAKSGDVVVVAALVRVAARLDLQGRWLSEAQRYLLSQQQSDGSFGMLAAEMEFLGGKKRANELATLRLTVEVLWALAELAAFVKRWS